MFGGEENEIWHPAEGTTEGEISEGVQRLLTSPTEIFFLCYFWKIGRLCACQNS